MEVTEQLVQHLANLSKLQFSNEETKELRSDLNNMIGFVNQLQQVNTESVAPLLHMCEPLEILREDEVSASLTNEAATNNATNAVPPFFAVPKVISK